MMKLSAILVVFSVAMAVAARPQIYNSDKEPAVQGHDVVAYFDGNEPIKPVKGKKEFVTTYMNIYFCFSQVQCEPQGL